ncbi:MAG: phage Gp37/Gp68 family protein [Chloroflexi bacterium]|nr:phage Gp37/Gp68 family protein [Chloroflexota bacterium]
MGDKSRIEWTDATWNPVTGCDRISPGCDNCYALTQAARLQRMGNRRYQRDGKPPRSGPGFGVTLHRDVLWKPSGWRKPRRVFVNSMSDLFHESVPAEFIDLVFAEMWIASQHVFQVLTKRHRRMHDVLTSAVRHREDSLYWHSREPAPHIWLGVSIENQQWADARIPWLLKTPAAVRFLSIEPMLGPVDLSAWIDEGDWWCDACDAYVSAVTIDGQCASCGYDEVRWHPVIDWVIVGGESGHKRRPLDKDWVRAVRDQCIEAGVAFFYKQGSAFYSGRDRELDGRTWDEYPA